MTGRENRKARREQERQARKLVQKEAPREIPVSEPLATANLPAARLVALEAASERELEGEFGKDFLAHSRALGDRIARSAGLLPPHGTSFRNTPPSATPGRSTGPRTPEGKATSSRNSLKHGLSTGTLLIPGEDPAAFESLRESLHHEHQPADATEQVLVDDLAQSHWLRQRALRLQNECFTADGGVDEKRLALFLRYGTTHERAFHKALAALLRIKKERSKIAPPAVNPFVSQNKPVPPQFVSQKPVSQNPAILAADSLEFVSQTPQFAHPTPSVRY